MSSMLTTRTDEISLPNLHILLFSLAPIASTPKLLIVFTKVRLIVLVGERLELHTVEHDLLLLVRAPRLRVLTIIVFLSQLFFFGNNLLL